MGALKRDQLNFKFTPEVELFVVRQYAEFQNPLKICENIAELFFQYCEKDIEKHGQDEFLRCILSRVYDLSPKRDNFPKKYEVLYQQYRRDYLENLDASYLAHKRNRVRELEMLYQKIMVRADNEKDSTQFRGFLSVAKDLIKEVRTEMDNTRITVEASIQDGEAKVVATQAMQKMSTEELKELMKTHGSSNTISTTAIEPPVEEPEPESDLSDSTGGTGSAGEGNGRAATRPDRETKN